MFVVEKLRLNCFRNVSIPSAKDMFLRMGLRNQPMSDGQVADFSSSTMDQLDNLESQLLKDSQIPPDLEI